MTRPPPRSTRTDKLFPYTTLFRFLARLAADLQRGGDHVGRAFVIPGLARIGLVVPDVLAGIGIECNDRRKIQIVAVARAAPVDIVRTAVADTDVDLIEFRIEGEIGRASCRERVCQYV